MCMPKITVGIESRSKRFKIYYFLEGKHLNTVFFGQTCSHSMVCSKNVLAKYELFGTIPILALLAACFVVVYSVFFRFEEVVVYMLVIIKLEHYTLSFCTDDEKLNFLSQFVLRALKTKLLSSVRYTAQTPLPLRFPSTFCGNRGMHNLL